MITTLTNTSGVILNGPDQIDGGSGAVGGAVKNPLPFPFNRNGQVAIAGTLVLPTHPSDYIVKEPYARTFMPKDELNQMVQAGKITLSHAAETGRRDVWELFIDTI